MSQGNVTRPEAEKRKIHSRNEFELCYIRHQYFRRAANNPSVEEMEPYMDIVKNLSRNTFYTYINLLHMVGFELEDVTNIAMVHLVSFLGLFSLESMPAKHKDFEEIFQRVNVKNPKEKDFHNKNRANFTIFLKQRMEDVVRVCRQKARNIKGLPTEEYFFFYGPNPPPLILRNLIKNCEKLGFRKLDTAIYKSIKKNVKPEDGPVFYFNGNYYISISVDQKSLTLIDFNGAGMDPYDSIHNMTPEQIFFSAEEREKWSRAQEKFNSKTVDSKIGVLSQFIANNKGNPKYKQELRAARKLLREMGKQNGGNFTE